MSKYSYWFCVLEVGVIFLANFSFFIIPNNSVNCLNAQLLVTRCMYKRVHTMNLNILWLNNVFRMKPQPRKMNQEVQCVVNGREMCVLDLSYFSWK